MTTMKLIPTATLAASAAFAALLFPGNAPPAAQDEAPRDLRGLPYYMIPNIPDAAKACWAPDSRHLIAQTRDKRALPTKAASPAR